MNKQLFLESEGNNFYLRNKEHIITDNDIILTNLNINKYNNNTIVEIGCSNGWRLNELCKINPNNKYIGIEPSIQAQNEKASTDIEIINGTCDNINLLDNSVDVIMVPFVFMYIDRNLLFKSVNEIDRILKNNGKLVITDFYSNKPRKNIYKHTPNTFIYKQNYFEIFTCTHNYFLTKLECFIHNTSNNFDNYDDTCFYAELIKDTNNLMN